MFVGRDFSELLMYPKTDWTDKELAFYHHSFQQIVPYLNIEGLTIHKEIVNELIERGGLINFEADETHGSRLHYD